MAFKFVLFGAVCLAQAFAFPPATGVRGNACNNLEVQIPFQFEKTMMEMDSVREEMSMTMLEAHESRNNVGVVIKCTLRARRDYVRLGARLSEMMRNSTTEMSGTLREKAEKYEKLMEGPVKAITVVMREVPVKVYDLIQKKQYIRAAALMVKATKTVEENARILGKHMRDMVSEVPEMADRVEEMAKEIYETARTGSETIKEAFRKCIEEGAPKNSVSSSEEDDSSDE